jgi:hypothetical protein
MIGVAMGINNLLEIFNEKYYENLEGGILESFGRLFRHSVKLYIYPMRQEAYDKYLSTGKETPGSSPKVENSVTSNVLITARNAQVVDNLRSLYEHLMQNHYIECIVGYDPTVLNTFSRDVLRRIKENDPSWERMVPDPVVDAIKRLRLFGYSG